MKRIILLCAAVVAVACASPVLAAPSFQFVNNFNNTVTLQVVTTGAGSLGVETAVTLAVPPTIDLLGATVNTSIFDTPNPGDNPFIPGSPVGGDSFGLALDLPNDRLFASFGSGPVSPGAYNFLTIAYSGYGTITASGLVGAQGQLTSGLTASITLIPEPTTTALVGLATLAAFARRRAG